MKRRIKEAISNKLSEYLNIAHSQFMQSVSTYLYNEEWRRLPLTENSMQNMFGKQTLLIDKSYEKDIETLLPSYKKLDLENMSYQDISQQKVKIFQFDSESYYNIPQPYQGTEVRDS